MKKIILAITALTLLSSASAFACNRGNCSDRNATIRADVSSSISATVNGAGIAGAHTSVSAQSVVGATSLHQHTGNGAPKYVGLEGNVGTDMSGTGYVYAEGKNASATADYEADALAKLDLGKVLAGRCRKVEAGLSLDATLHGERHLSLTSPGAGVLVAGGRSFVGFADADGRAEARLSKQEDGDYQANADVTLDGAIEIAKGKVMVDFGDGPIFTDPNVGGNSLSGSINASGDAFARRKIQYDSDQGTLPPVDQPE